MNYRVNFLVVFLDAVLFFVVNVAVFSALYLHTAEVSGWTREQMLLLLGTDQVITSVSFALFMDNLSRIPTYVRDGSLDLILSKPVPSLFYVSLARLNLPSLANLPLALFLSAWAALRIGIDFTPANVFLYLLTLALGLGLQFAIWLTVMTLAIWLVNVSDIHELFLSTMTLTKYPEQVFSGVSKVLFTYVVPIVLIANTPAKALLNRLNFPSLAEVSLVTVAWVMVAVAFWRRALSHYTSAGG